MSEQDRPIPHEEPILVSAVAHYGYCPRRAALIHIEHIWDENVFTLRGQQAHERVDSAGYHHGGGIRLERALPIWSDRHGLTGRADGVEFHPDGRIVPIEYKSGPAPKAVGGRQVAVGSWLDAVGGMQQDVGSRQKTSTAAANSQPPTANSQPPTANGSSTRASNLQLCAQALCLEEMFQRPVTHGAIYHVASRSRREVEIDDNLRAQLEEVIRQIRSDQAYGRTPPPVNDNRCPNCSLNEACVPAVLAEARMDWHLKDLFKLEREP